MSMSEYDSYGMRSKDYDLGYQRGYADAKKKERPHGKWIEILPFSTGKCSLCGNVANITNFCPNCGADMRVKDELNRVSKELNKELNNEIEKSKGKILPDYCDGLLYSITNGDNFIGKEGEAE